MKKIVFLFFISTTYAVRLHSVDSNPRGLSQDTKATTINTIIDDQEASIYTYADGCATLLITDNNKRIFVFKNGDVTVRDKHGCCKSYNPDSEEAKYYKELLEEIINEATTTNT